MNAALKRKWAMVQKSAQHIAGGVPASLLFRLALRLPALRERQFRCRWNGSAFWTRPVDDVAFQEILLKGEYDFAARLLADETAAPTIIDGGANVGLFSLAMLHARPDATAHSLEPDTRTFRVLARNAAANPQLRWHAHALALWKTNGSLKFSATTDSTGSRVHELAPAGREETVAAITLTDFLATHAPGEIALLKLDIEGAEEAVLRESEAVLDRVRHLVLEIHPAVVDEVWIMQSVARHFPFVHSIGGRKSVKPLILASRTCREAPDG